MTNISCICHTQRSFAPARRSMGLLNDTNWVLYFMNPRGSRGSWVPSSPPRPLNSPFVKLTDVPNCR